MGGAEKERVLKNRKMTRKDEVGRGMCFDENEKEVIEEYEAFIREEENKGRRRTTTMKVEGE